MLHEPPTGQVLHGDDGTSRRCAAGDRFGVAEPLIVHLGHRLGWETAAVAEEEPAEEEETLSMRERLDDSLASLPPLDR